MACPRTCLIKNTDFQNFHVCGKNQTCVGIANDYLNYHVCGFYHTCVDFTKYLRHVKVFGKNHTCVGRYKHVCVFQNTGWFILYLLLYLTKSFEILNLQHIINFRPGEQIFLDGNKAKRAIIFHMCGNSHTHKTIK